MRKLIYILIVLLLIGCTTPTKESETSTQEKVSITDDKQTIEVVKNPQRIVVFDYAVIDLLQYINYEVEVLGAVKDSAPDYLENYVENAQDIGGLKEPSLEKIAALKPDVIFIGGRTIDYYDDLMKIAPVIYFGVDNSNYLESTKRINQELAKIFDAQEAVDKQIEQLDFLVDETKEVIQSKELTTSVLMVDGGTLSAFGSGSRFGYLFDDLGIKNADNNIEVSTHGQEVSYEYVLNTNPNLILYVDRGALQNKSDEQSETLSNELIQKTEAYQNDLIKPLDSNRIYMVSGGLQSVLGTIQEIKTIFETIE